MAKPERYWDAAREKVEREGRCRACGTQFMLQFAHTVGRAHDQVVDLEDGSRILYVDPLDGIPLCIDCHAKYDQRKLSILEHLNEAEQARAVEHLGILRALHRLTGQRDYALETPAFVA